MKYTYSAVFSEKNKKVYARVPDLDGCITTGKTLIDAMDQMADAMAAWLCTAEDENLAIPVQTVQAKIKHNKDDLLSLIKADTLAYRAATDTRAVRKNVSLPQWLFLLADRKHINCSQVLQEALLARL